MNTTTNYSKYITQENPVDCFIDSKQLINDFLLSNERTMLWMGLLLLGFWVLFFFLEFMKMGLLKSCSIEKYIKIQEWMSYFQRGIILFSLLPIARILQLAVWGLI